MLNICKNKYNLVEVATTIIAIFSSIIGFLTYANSSRINDLSISLERDPILSIKSIDAKEYPDQPIKSLAILFKVKNIGNNTAVNVMIYPAIQFTTKENSNLNEVASPYNMIDIDTAQSEIIGPLSFNNEVNIIDKLNSAPPIVVPDIWSDELKAMVSGSIPAYLKFYCFYSNTYGLFYKQIIRMSLSPYINEKTKVYEDIYITYDRQYRAEITGEEYKKSVLAISDYNKNKRENNRIDSILDL